MKYFEKTALSAEKVMGAIDNRLALLKDLDPAYSMMGHKMLKKRTLNQLDNIHGISYRKLKNVEKILSSAAKSKETMPVNKLLNLEKVRKDSSSISRYAHNNRFKLITG